MTQNITILLLINQLNTPHKPIALSFYVDKKSQENYIQENNNPNQCLILVYYFYDIKTNIKI